MVFERIDGKTEFGGAYREIFYFNADMMPTEKEIATRAIVRECNENGALINEQILILKK